MEEVEVDEEEGEMDGRAKEQVGKSDIAAFSCALFNPHRISASLQSMPCSSSSFVSSLRTANPPKSVGDSRRKGSQQAETASRGEGASRRRASKRPWRGPVEGGVEGAVDGNDDSKGEEEEEEEEEGDRERERAPSVTGVVAEG